MYVYIMHMSHFLAPHAISRNSGAVADADMSGLICIMCAIEISKLLFTLEPFSLCILAYQSRGDDMEEGRADRTGPGV